MGAPAKILVVDDYDSIRGAVCSLLTRQSNWKIYQAENGKSALDRIREIKPDVVVMDIVMPDMSGLEAASRIRQIAPETKVILMSSYYTTQEATTINRIFGDSNFIEKAEIWRDLVPAINRLIPHDS
jgi:DNA-binding NtrC family response regulator